MAANEHDRALKTLHRLEQVIGDLHADWPAIADFAEIGQGQYGQVENVAETLGDLTTLRSYIRDLIAGMATPHLRRFVGAGLRDEQGRSSARRLSGFTWSSAARRQ
ncbi:MAG TPA: hypothetical protein VIN56_10155 [Candidatus Dormibacteraeota bacterium]|jgi:hypothetical protein